MKGIGGTLALIAVLTALGVAFWLSGGQPDSTGEGLTSSALDGRYLMRADRIAIQNDPDGLPIEFESDGGGGFRVVEPVRDLASDALLESIARVYDAAELSPAYAPDEITAQLLEDTGLDRPRARLTAEWADGHRVELAIGLNGPLGRDVFARKDGAIWRAQQALHTSLQFTPQAARDPFVFKTLPGQVERLRLIRRTAAGKTESLAVERRGGGPWQMTEPAVLRVDEARVQSFVAGLLGLRVARFLPGAPSELVGPTGPEAPADAVIEVTGLAGAERVILRGLPDSGTLIGDSDVRDTWFTVEARDYAALLATQVLALRAAWLIAAPIDEAERLRIEVPGESPIELVRRSGAAFSLAQPVSSRTWPTAVSELIQALRALSVREFVDDHVSDLDAYGLGQDRTVISIHAGRWRQPELLYLGADRGDGVTWLRRADEPHVVAIDSGTAAVFRRPWTVYVDRRVSSVESPSMIRRIRQVKDGVTAEFERGDDGAFHRVGDPTAVPIVDEIADLLVSLTAERVLPADAWVVSRSATIAATGVGGQVLAAIAVGLTADGTYLAQRGTDAEFVFELRMRDGRDLLEVE